MNTAKPSTADIDRDQQRSRFLSAAGHGLARLEPLAGDASFRRYYRLREDGGSWMLMDAPPPREDVRPFLAVAAHLRRLGLRPPAIHAEDVDAGFALLEDLGDDTFTRRLAAGDDAQSLYRMAVDTLLALHQHGEATDIELPAYDAAELLGEAMLLPDWGYRLVHGRDIDAAARNDFAQPWRAALAAMPSPAMSLVLRDFHVDNLMRIDHGGAVQCALLDFQDARIGPAAYDLASLLQDARRDIDEDFEARFIDYYLARQPLLDRDGFLAWYHLLAAQRHAKVIGIFSRLALRDGKPGYLAHLPRVWRGLERGLALPALAPLRDWLSAHFPDRLQGVSPVHSPSRTT